MTAQLRQLARPSLTLVVPVPPSLNHAYTNGRGHGRRVLSAEGRDYKDTVKKALFATACIHMLNCRNRRWGLTLRLWFKNRQRRDISNCVKLVEDALSEALGFDDCAVDRLLVERAGYDAVRPRCEVLIEVLP